MFRLKNGSNTRFLKVLFVIVFIMGAGLFIQMLPSLFKKSEVPTHQADKPVKNINSEHEGAALPGSAPEAVLSGSVTPSKVQSPTEVRPLTEEESKKLTVLHEILISKNDNDPRMDSELKVLSPALKAALKKEYTQTAPEKLNDLGTIVFLLGRNLQTAEDFEFMKSVIDSPTCKSFTDCSRDSTHFTEEDRHQESTDAVTLSYPQWNAFLAVEAWLNANDYNKLQPDQRNYFNQVIESAMRSPNLVLASRARSLQYQIRQ